MARATDAEIENLTQRPSRRSLCGAVRNEFYWKCLLSTLLVYLCICYGVWCHLNHYAYAAQLTFTYSHGPCAQGYNFIPIAFGVMLYIVYLMECWHSRVKNCKIKKVDRVEAMEYVEKMRAASPIVWWKSVCYHYVRRTRQVTRYRNGDVITATQAYYERVNSHSAGNVFVYDMCGVKDISKNLVDLERFPVTRIRFSKGFVFACMQAASEFEEQRARFFSENEVRDDYLEVREGLDFADLPFTEHMIAFSSPSHKCPWYLSAAAFWLCSILLLSWPLRLLCEMRTAHVHYQFTKLFGTNYLSPSSVNYTGPLTRTSTMDSGELELAAQRDCYLIVPSYSEAMLYEPSTTAATINTGASRNHPNQCLLANGHYRTRDQPLTSCNENLVIANYGAIGRPYPGREPPGRGDLRRSSSRNALPSRLPTRSRSISFMSTRSQRQDPSMFSTSSTALPRSANGGPPRSISISGLSAAWRSSGYNSISEEPADDHHPLIAPRRPLDEPPPPYEMALRMCAPLYERLRRSANSITSRLNSASRSSSKDFSHRRQLNMDTEQTSSKDAD